MCFKGSLLRRPDTNSSLAVPRAELLIHCIGFPSSGRILPGLAMINSAGLCNRVVTFCSFCTPRPFYLNSGLYWRIWHMDLVQSAVLYSVMTLVSTYLVAFAYKNVKFVLKHK